MSCFLKSMLLLKFLIRWFKNILNLFNISMMLNKCNIRWFRFNVNTKAQQTYICSVTSNFFYFQIQRMGINQTGRKRDYRWATTAKTNFTNTQMSVQIISGLFRIVHSRLILAYILKSGFFWGDGTFYLSDRKASWEVQI